MLADTWRYTGGDSCARFFSLSLQDVKPPVSDECRTLEIGCSEFDWLSVARQCWPRMALTGIDWRAEERHRYEDVVVRRADVRQADLFPPNRFDLIVSISAIEHVGLGHYGKPRDPVDPNGDITAIENSWEWLVPGGWLFFDVPWKPGEGQYMVAGTSHRVYDRATLRERFWSRKPWRVMATTVAGKGVEGLIKGEPPPCSASGEDFYYFGMWLQKPE